MGKFPKIIITLLMISVLPSFIVMGQSEYNDEYIRFQHLDISDGLSQSTAISIMQDKKGFLWLCTNDGLNRYDGYGIKIYRNDPNDPNSISNNYIFAAYEDHSGFLWFGTADGLNRYNPQNGHFISYKFGSEDSTSLSGNFVFSVYESPGKPGILWVGTNGGLDKLVLNDKGIASLIIHYKYSNSKEPDCISNNTVAAIAEDKSGQLWIGTNDGLNRFNPENENFTWYKNDSRDPNSLCDNSITFLYPDKSGALWVGTNNGLDKLLPDNINNISPVFLHYKNDPQNINSLSNNHVCSILESRAGVIWVGTQNGLNKIVPKSSDRLQLAFIRYYKNINDPNSLLDNWVHSVIEDRSGIIWVGTHNGISKLSPKKNRFLPFRFQNNIFKGLNNKSISAIYQGGNGILWLGASDEGLIRFDNKNGQIVHYENDPNNPQSLSNNKVRSILEDRSGNLWIGTITGGGLNLLDRTNNKFVHYFNDPHNPSTISNNIILVLYEDRDGNIWVGTFGGLNKFDKKNNQFIRYLNDPKDANSLCNDNIRAICEDVFGDLWIGTNNGLDKFDRKTKNFIHYSVNSQNPNSLSSKIIISLYGDKAGNLWIGTFDGLNKLDIKKGIVKRYGVRDGLPNEVINGILEDDQDNLWLSTNKGLSKFNPRIMAFYNYDVNDGLPGNEFNVGACFKSKDGEMFFGGVNGINAFNPNNIRQSTFIPTIVITSFLKYNKEVTLDKSISELDQLELSYKDFVFSFEFASLDYQAPGENKYAYKMEGLDEQWTYTTADKRFASYTTLPAGDYVFRVKGTNSDGLWNENGTAIKIIITPPFWQTWWFRTLVVLVLIVFLYSLYKKRIKKIEEKKKILELQVKEKTEAAQKIQAALSEVEKLKNQLQVENIYLQDEIKISHNFESIISTSESFRKILYKVEQVSSTDATVLILGESGTGKELLARAIHSLSNRQNKPLVKINCAALPSNLIESELFGHEKGAFTGAYERKIGRFEIADSGTIFLDEIGDLPLELQTKLLRVLQEGEFERLGGSIPISVDVRVIAATNCDLEEALKQGTFREDLYYRLNVFPIKVPPLRERKEDIPILVNYFINKHCGKTSKKIESISPQNMNKLIEYDWPGNVRELENVIERAIIVTTSKALFLDDSFLITKIKKKSDGFKSLEEIERDYIIEVLESTKWRVSGPKGAAKILGLVPSTLEFRMKKLNIIRK